jgi:hypothetical protein
MEPDPRSTRRLAVCLVCRRNFVVPVTWDEHDDEHWQLVLRCGACDAMVEFLASDAEVYAFCEESNLSLDRLAARAARLDRARMTAEVDVFVAALELDLISGDDFDR